MAERRQVIVDLTTRTGGGTAGIRKLKSDLGGVESGSVNAKSGLKGMNTQVGSLGKGLRGLAPSMSTTAVAAGAVGGAVLLAGKGIKASIDAFSSYEDKLNQSMAIMGDLSDMQRGEMSDAAREVAKTTRLSADEAAESYFFLASAGLDAEQSIAALPQVAAFAQAGMFDMATATDLATDAQSALGLTVDDAQENLKNMTRVTDVFVKANVLANTSVQQVSEAITNKLGGSLRSYNIDLEEGVAVLAAYADQGLKGAAAGESFNIVLRDLKRAANDNAAAFAANNIEVFDSQGNFRNMADIIADLEGAFGDLSVQEQTNLANQLGFQDRSFKNIQLLFGMSDAIREYEGELRQAGGTTAEVADNQLDSFAAQMDLVKSQIHDAGIEMGEQLAPTIGDLGSTFGDLIEVATPVIGLLGKILSISLKPFADTLKLVSRGVQEVSAWFDPAAKEALNFDKAMDKVNTALDKGEPGVNEYADGLRFLADNGDLTAENMQKLGEGVEFVGDQQAEAIRQVWEYAEANGYASDQVEILRQGLLDEIDAMDLDIDAKNRLAQELGLVTSATSRHGGAFKEAAGAAEDLADAEGDVEGAAGDAEQEIRTLEDALNAATAAQESLSDAMKSFADPTFAAVQAMGKYRDAEAKVAELQADGKEGTLEYAEAMVDLAEARLEAQAGLDAFSARGIEDQVSVIAEALRISDEQARELLETLGLIDGRDVNVLLNFGVSGPGAKYMRTGGTSGGGTTGKIDLLRAEGGPVTRGEPYIVGERGPEWFVPSQSGRIIPNGASMTTSNVSSTRNINISFHNPMLANDPMVGIREAMALDALSAVN